MNRVVLKLRKSPLMYLTSNMLLLRILAGRILEDANPKPVSPTLPILSVKESVTDVPSATIAPPPAITGPPLASTTNDHFHVSEITDPPTSVTIELPTESPPQTDEPINVDEEAPPMVPTGDDDVSENGDLDEEPAKETVFVHSMGAWSKPLHFTPPPTPLVPATPKLGVSDAVKGQIASFWPSLNDSIIGHKHKKEQLSYPPMDKMPPPALKDDGSLRFPWSARMNQSSRNLFRAAEPSYQLDGTPQVTIPSKVLRLGPENKEEYVVGQFHRCSNPPGGLIHAVLNRLWGRECKISCRKLGESSFLFHIPHENTRKWVIQWGSVACG
ncbi:LOW QUALITY PROTEIN: hypothetical protein Bca101_005223 [Brassica carinata]